MSRQIANFGLSRLLIISALLALTVLILSSKYFVLAAIPSLAILATLVMSKRPQIGVYILIFMIPFGAFRKIMVGSTEINLAWLVAGGTFLIFLADRIIHKKSFRDLRNLVSLWLGLFFLIAIVSTWLSPHIAASIKDFKLWIAALLYIILVLALVPKQGFRKTVPKLIIISVAISTFLGNIDYLFGLSLFTEDHMGGDLTRNVGATIDPNNLSLMIIASMPIIMHGFLYAKRPISKLAYAMLLANAVLGIGLTFSRGGFLVFVVVSALIAFEFRHFFKVKFIGFILLGISVSLSAFVIIMPDTFWQRQTSLTSWEDSSLVRRASYLEVASDAFLERPLFGHGLDSFYQIYAQTQYAKIDKETGKILGRYAHNSYLEILVGTGIIGLIAFLMLLFTALKAFTIAKQRYLMANMKEEADFIACLRLFLFATLFYLLIFSETHHKFMLVGLALSQLALRYSQIDLIENKKNG
ncbi:O-antigen ligase family protein [Pseudoalteromonas sp.]|uniref:O-antigen ligase family protein n=1 Tax=Pseudoalteromonas sp. TaxID=53249 RepID=UPI00356694D8